MPARLAALVVALVLAAPAPAAARAPRVTARAAALLDVGSGRFLFLRDADDHVSVASLVKMVTALVVADRLRPDDAVRISRRAARAQNDTMRWPEGATFSADDVLHGMLMESSNGAALALAERVAGTVGTFVGLMNERAREAGARRSRFANPHGLDAPGQYSTARDVALVGAAFLRVPWLAGIAATRNYRMPWHSGGTAKIGNYNTLIRSYPGANGIKTGFTSRAGKCLAASATRGSVTLVAVLLNDADRYGSATRLLDHGFRLVPVGPLGTEPAAARGEIASPAAAPVGTVVPVAAAVPSRVEAKPLWPRLAAILVALYAARVAQVRRRRRRRARARAASSTT